MSPLTSISDKVLIIFCRNKIRVYQSFVCFYTPLSKIKTIWLTFRTGPRWMRCCGVSGQILLVGLTWEQLNPDGSPVPCVLPDPVNCTAPGRQLPSTPFLFWLPSSSLLFSTVVIRSWHPWLSLSYPRGWRELTNVFHILSGKKKLKRKKNLSILWNKTKLNFYYEIL